MLHHRRGAGFLLPLAALISLLLLLGSLSVQAMSLQGRLRGAAERDLQTAEDRLSSAAQLLIARIQLRHACLLSLPLERWAGAGCASAGELEELRRGSVLGTSWQLLRWQPEASSEPAAAAPSTLSPAAPPTSPLATGTVEASTVTASSTTTSSVTASEAPPSTQPSSALPTSAVPEPTLTGAMPAGSTQSTRLTLELVLPAGERQPARRGGFALQLQGPPWRVIELRPLGLRGEAS